ncbi:hypothetical protein H1D32_16305 [Anaerobacillus sp. CMMVII]|uniref:hypothetical protein n=1 Tax=Anaerobacillus sp. CMMVII TaxID=2755588 RepID=UPI0021B6F3B1|nr:hypothetical protein [Anaerobacillus sp. CMMVII]MCT8139127.1 hypothetical protein [Anaerobacillus sp. CMMVII]
METVEKQVLVSSQKQTVVIPFSFTHIPLKKLALINFKKNADSKYLGLEPQYLDDKVIGKGYRVIAYRNDGYVDVYDDMSLNDNKDDSFDVTGKGLCERVKVEIKNTRFEKVDNRVFISFQFTDKYRRSIDVSIVENSTKKTKGLNLLAPVGSSTKNPSYLPLFFLYNFDFVRKYNTTFQIHIDGNTIKAANFPVPMPKDFQWRSYTRYSDDCQIIEFANETIGVLEEFIPNDNGKVVRDDGLEYDFSECGCLNKIALNQGNHPLTVVFTNGFPDVRSVSEDKVYKDTFEISGEIEMGVVSGDYSVKRDENRVTIELFPNGGWKPKPDSPFTKLLFKEKSIFCSWPKTYKYTQVVDLTTLESSSNWVKI